MVVISATISALIFSLAATVYLCLDDGLDFLLTLTASSRFSCKHEEEMFSLFVQPRYFFTMLVGSFGQICPEC